MAKSKAKAGSFRSVLPLLLLFGPALLLIFISTRGCEHKFKKLDDYGKVETVRFTDVNGKEHSTDSFKDEIVLYTTIQTSCPDTCGVSVWHLDQLVYQNLRKNRKKLNRIKIISFVTDEKGNPSSNIADINFMLKDRVEGFDPNIWMVVTGDPKKMFSLEKDGRKLVDDEAEGYFKDNQYLELMLLSDKSNHLRMALPGKTESTIRRMRDCISLLQKEYDIDRYQKTHSKK